MKKWPLPARQEAFDAEVREGLGRGVQGDDVTGDVRVEGGGMGGEGALERGAGVDVGVGSGAGLGDVGDDDVGSVVSEAEVCVWSCVCARLCACAISHTCKYTRAHTQTHTNSHTHETHTRNTHTHTHTHTHRAEGP